MPGTFTYTVATNTVVVTGGTAGSPADFASFAAADRAGAGTSLLAAWAPNSNTKALTYQVRPVELLALLISFVVAAKTAEADYIFITGTDWLGAAQTESLDVSAGNGTYVTTKYFRTITNIDCSDNAAGGGTVWADGTVAVTQPIWGVIWKLLAGFAYRLSCNFTIGNGSTATYFAMLNQYCVVDDGFRFMNVALGTFKFGDWINGAPAKCSTLVFLHTVTATNYWGGPVYFYGGLVSNQSGAAHNFGMPFQGSGEIIGTSFCNFLNAYVKFEAAGLVIEHVNVFNSIYSIAIQPTIPPINAFSGGSSSTNANFMNMGNNITIINADSLGGSQDARAYYNFGPLTLLNPQFTPTRARLIISTGGGPIYWDVTVNVKVTDTLGVAINAAAVILKDKDGNTIFSVTSGADGKITQQQIRLKSWTGTSETEFSYTPHTLTIAKAGYQDYQDVITIDRKMDLEVALRRPPYPLMIQEAVHAVA